ncbi:MAG TPA: ABC transporter substrate-binding protein [Burkholderiales bacterium]|nr:ABC transporter substrate-binding protein [Burkholderiales bacterium]
MESPARSGVRMLLLLVAILFAPGANAQGLSPDALVRAVSSDVISSIRDDRELQAGNQRKLIELVTRAILPHVDAPRMTRLALGAAWRQATPTQQQKLTLEFTALLIHTYSGALAAYRDRAMIVGPLRAGADETEVAVRSQIRQAGAPPIAVDFFMARTQSGWKVYDVKIDGVSLVSTYRATFSEEVRNRGIEGLIDLLSARNREHGRRIDTLTGPPATGRGRTSQA